MASNTRIPVPARVAIGLELFVSVGAFYGASLGLGDPSGVSFQMPAGDFLRHSPFEDWLVPSLILLFVNGLFPLVVVALILRKSAWAAQAIIVHGVFLGGWITVQVAMLRAFYAPLHLPYLLLGGLIAALGVLARRSTSRTGLEPAP